MIKSEKWEGNTFNVRLLCYLSDISLNSSVPSVRLGQVGCKNDKEIDLRVHTKLYFAV